MSFLELALRVYVLLSGVPVLGFIVLLLVDLSSATKVKRRDLHHADPVP
jgi:hypothetical protein